MGVIRKEWEGFKLLMIHVFERKYYILGFYLLEYPGRQLFIYLIQCFLHLFT